MNSLRLNVAIILVVISGCAAGLAVVVGLGSATSAFARENRDVLMLALPVITALSGVIGGYLVGTATSDSYGVPRRRRLVAREARHD